MNCNLKSIAAAVLLHANVRVQQVLTQAPATQPTNPIMCNGLNGGLVLGVTLR